MGGVGSGSCSAGAGTLYFKSASQTYGDLVVDNKGSVQCASSGGTVINSPTIAANDNVTSNLLTKTGAFGDVYSSVSPYVNWYVDPKISQNSSPKKSDNQLFKVVSANVNSLTTAGGNMTSVAAIGDTGEMVLVFDSLEIGDHTKLSVGNLRMLAYKGDLRSNDDTSVLMTDVLPPRGIEYVGAQSINLNLSTATLPAFLNEDFGTANLSLSNGAFSFNSLTVGNFISNTMTLAGTKIRATGSVNFSGTTAVFTQAIGKLLDSG